MKIVKFWEKKWIARVLMFSLLAFPASSNYKLEGFSFGNAGGGNVGTSNYGIEANIGEVGGNRMSGVSYDLGSGLAFIRQAGVPRAPTLVNDGNFYNKLKLTLDNTNSGVGSSTFSIDTKYVVAISKDDWATTQYVKSDMTVGTSLTATDYMTYTQWGGSGGGYIIGLDSETTYKVKATAMQGKYTETDWGPSASAVTVAPTLTFDIDVATTDIQTTPPYLIDVGDLIVGNVVTGTNKIWISIDTNGSNGAGVFVYGQNGGLYSLSAGYTIPSVSGNLAVLPNGFGAQAVGATQSSGGPMSIDDYYNLTSDVVGITDLQVRQIFTMNSPVVGGRASLVVKAKSDNSVPSASDYSETLTVIAAANF